MSVSEHREEDGELSVIFILGPLISVFPKPFLGSVFFVWFLGKFVELGFISLMGG